MNRNSIVYHILKRFLQFFLIFMIFGLLGKSYLSIFSKEVNWSWLPLVPIVLFSGVVIRDITIRSKKRKNQDNEEESTDNPAVTLFVKRIVQFFLLFVILKTLLIAALLIFFPDTENSHTAHSIVNIIPMLWFLGIILWDFFKKYKLNRAGV